jgi:hypothetical protein
VQGPVQEPQQLVQEPQQLVQEPQQLVQEPQQLVQEPQQLVQEKQEPGLPLHLRLEVLLHSRGFELQQQCQARLAVLHQLCLLIGLQQGLLLQGHSVQLQEFVQLIQLAQELDPLLLQGHSYQRCSKPLLVLQVCTQHSDQVLR